MFRHSVLKNADPLRAFAVSRDGKFLLSGGGTAKLWDISTGKILKIFPIDSRDGQVIACVAFSPDGKIALTSTELKNGHIQLWNVATGKLIKETESHLIYAHSVQFTSDGKYVLSSGGLHSNPTLLEVSSEKFLRDYPGYGQYYQGFGQLSYVNLSAVALSPDNNIVASGAKDHDVIKLSEFSTGKLIRELRGHEDGVNSICFSPDGRYLLSTGIDATTRLWNVATGEQIAGRVSSEDAEWTIFTSDGYYNTSAEGTSLVKFRFSGEPIEVFSFEQFQSVFKRPDVLTKRMGGDPNVGKPVPAQTRPPYIEMSEHLQQKETTEASYPLKLSVSAVDKIRILRIFVNGKSALDIPIDAQRNELELDIPLVSGANRITAIAYNEKGFSSNPKYVDVICIRADLSQPNLYVVGVGISKYQNLPQEWQLSYAHSDAKAISEAFKGQEGKIFGHVHTKLLMNEEATPENIAAALKGLDAISENDVAIIFLAGHGILAKDGTFYFLTPTCGLEDPEKGGISWNILGESLAKVKGRVLLLLDACHSGNISTETVVPNDDLAQKLRSEGRCHR